MKKLITIENKHNIISKQKDDFHKPSFLYYLFICPRRAGVTFAGAQK